jgi:imidazolonepropionase-like amidohydrolase
MAPGDVVRAATINTARAIGRNDIGGLMPGMWADMVVLTENPAKDISATRAIKSVWIAGVEVKR